MNRHSNFESNTHRGSRRPSGAVVALSIAAALGTFAGSHALLAQEHAKPARPQEALAHAYNLSDAFKYASQTVEPCVVNIRSTQHIQPVSQRGGLGGGGMGGGMGGGGMPFDDDTMKRFFGDQLPPGIQGDPRQQQPRERSGEGSGVIMREDGYIVTNNHVIDGADEIVVTLSNESQYPGTVVGTDPDTDLAVVKIDAAGLNTAKFGDSEGLDVGEWVLAIGSPFGLQHTVTAGIISAKGRSGMNLATFEDFIQTDAAINPGNSGGALINLEGELVGINTAISSQTGGNIGLGFAIPSNMVKSVFDSIVENGGVKRGALGVGIESLDKDSAEYFGFDGTDGVLLSQVYPNSAADQAGLKVGDIITEINGRRIDDRTALLNTIALYQPGKTVEIKAFRKGHEKTFEVTLGDRAVQFAKFNRGESATGKAQQSPEAQATASLGLNVEELTPEIAQQLNAEGKNGVVITAVEPGSAAASKGLQRGDIITMVGEHPVASTDDFATAMKNADASKGVALQITRGEATRLVVLKAKAQEKSE